MNKVDAMFRRVKFDETDREIHTESYNAVKQIAQAMDNAAPDCIDKTLAFRALHLALMHFGAALSRHEKYKPLDELPPAHYGSCL